MFIAADFPRKEFHLHSPKRGVYQIPPFCTKTELEYDYLTLDMSETEIAEKYHLPGRSRVSTWRKRFGIPAKPQARRHRPSPHLWREGKMTYGGYHARVRSVRGCPKRCEVCATEEPSKRYEWANLTGDYSNIWDYKRMCRSCHHKHDRMWTHLYKDGKHPNTRKTHCKRGHLLSGDNIFYYAPANARRCRACRKLLRRKSSV